MPKIVQLSSHVADLIAAGEVVERPASVVKELVENAIDAGATRVTIEIQNGGMTFIRISDNGCGMSPEDARTAFLRHATSKIRNKDDLAAISTLGFRGEALAAISAVSRIDLLTKAEDTPGVSLHLDAGQITQEAPAGCPEGTTILVRDLFYNTPARMKFMKSDQAEASAVFLAVQQQALAHPEIAFRFLKDGAEQLSTSGSGDRMSAIYTVFGRELSNSMVEVNGNWEQFTVRGFVTKPTCTRGNRSYQYFFVNSRFIKSKLLSSALEQAYKNQLMVGRFPACVLELDLPVQAVDVNVHPAKTEVKFLSERGAFDAVHYAVLSALNKAPGRPAVQLPATKHDAIAQSLSSGGSASKQDAFRTMTAEEFRRTASAPEVNPFSQVIRPAAKPVSVFVDEPVCNCDHIHAVSDQHGGVRVPESVRVQVREVMPLCELAQPACEAVRVYRCTVVLHKQKAAVLPAVAVLEPEFIVPRPIFPQKLHGLFRERKKRRVLRFRRTFINAELREIEKRGVNADDMILKVDFLPLETADVLPASSRNQEQMQHRFPLDGLLLCCVQNGGDGVRLVKIRLAFPDLWR